MRKDIVFVCSGNTCRSPMAEYLFRDFLMKHDIFDDVQVSSAGLFANSGMPATNLAITVMQEIGIDISCHRSRQLTQQIIDASYAIVCMTYEHQIFVIKNFTGVNDKCYMISHPDMIDVKDPFAGSLDDYRHTRDIIQNNLHNIFNILTSNEN